MESDKYYLKVAHARDLTGTDRVIYRIFEIIPGALTWGTFALIILLSIFKPVWAAIFIIAFDLYWLLKTAHLSFHHYYNWKRLKHNMKVDWQKMLEGIKYEHFYHMIILPYYTESLEVIEESVKSLLASKYDTKKMIIVMACEERAGEEAYQYSKIIEQKYGHQFGHFTIAVHPQNLPGEIKGKGPNISFAAEHARVEVLDKNNIPYEDVIVSAFDIDTVVGEHYFGCLTWHFCTHENPYSASFQPIPLYNNNMWETPAISRVAAMTSTFWQMIQQERPEKLVTFSSHSLAFKSLYEVGYWQKNMISDDSRIFFNLFLLRDGDYTAVPLSYPVSMDANLAPKWGQTVKNIYKQHFRWMWGVENIPYLLFGCMKNKKIPFKKKFEHIFVQIEGFWSLATNPIMILVLGWLPIILGGSEFRDTVLSYNLPHITQLLMTIATSGLLLSLIIAASLLPKRPKHLEGKKSVWIPLTLQWLFVPFTIILFGSLPGIDAQTRLMLGKYVGAFWVTPKHRK